MDHFCCCRSHSIYAGFYSHWSERRVCRSPNVHNIDVLESGGQLPVRLAVGLQHRMVVDIFVSPDCYRCRHSIARDLGEAATWGIRFNKVLGLLDAAGADYRDGMDDVVDRAACRIQHKILATG
jgi:hypothetical protein